MQRDFTIVDSLALKQLRHFYGSKCLFAKIAIPYTIYLSLDLPEFYVWQSISMSNDRCARMWSGHLFAEIAIPCTIYISLYLHSFYIYQHRSADILLGCTFLQYTTYTCYFCDAPSPLPFYKIQKSLYSRRIFAKIKWTKNIDSFKKK